MQTVSRLALISWLSLVSAFSMDDDKGVQEIHSMIDKFYKGYQEDIMRVRQQNEVLDKKLSDEKSQNASLQQQINQLEEILAGQQQLSKKSLEGLAAQKNVFITEQREKIDKLTSKNKELTKQAQEAQRLAKELSRAMQREQVWKAGGEKYKAENSKLEKQIEELKKKNKELLEERDECIRITDENFRIRLQQQEISAMLDHNNKQLEAELEIYRKSDLNEVVDLKRQISIMQSAIDSASSKNKTLEDHIRQQEKDHQAEIEKLKQDHDNEIAELKKKHGEEIAKLKQEDEAAMTDKISQLRKEHDEKLIQQLDQQKAELDTNKLTETICRLNKEILEYGNYIKKVKEQLARAQEDSRRISIRHRDLLLSLSVFSEKLESSSNQNLKNQWNDLVAPYLSNK